MLPRFVNDTDPLGVSRRPRRDTCVPAASSFVGYFFSPCDTSSFYLLLVEFFHFVVVRVPNMRSCQQTVPRDRAVRNCPKKGKKNISLSFRTVWEKYDYVTMTREFPFASFLFRFSFSTRNFHAIAPWLLFLRPHLGPSSTLHVLAGLGKLVSVRVTGNR